MDLETTFKIYDILDPERLVTYLESTSKKVRAKIEIIESPIRSQNGSIFVFEGSLPSMAPYFVYTCKLQMYKSKTYDRCKVVYPVGDVHVSRPKDDTITNDVCVFLIEEATLRLKLNSPFDIALKDAREKIDEFAETHTRMEQFRESELFSESIDYVRFEAEHKLLPYYPNQHVGLRRLSNQQLLDAYQLLMTEPWKLLFERPFKDLKPIKCGRCQQAIEDFDVNVPPLINAAIAMWKTILETQNKSGCTLFSIKEIKKAYSMVLWTRKAIKYLDGRLIKVGIDGDRGAFAVIRDIERAESIIDSLDQISRNALASDPSQQREIQNIPDKKPLKPEQVAAFANIQSNWLTIVTGGPGNGKTEVISRVVARYDKVLVGTYVGKAVDVLKQRCAYYEHVYTLHYIYYYTKCNPGWLSQFDMIVIDEFSNIDSGLLAKFLRTVRNIACRLVIMGDPDQIGPISPGNPVLDIIKRYPDNHFKLTINLRVDDDAKDLADAAAAIRDNKLTRKHFQTESSSLTFVDPDNCLEGLLRSYGRNIKDFQVITLKNETRRALNTKIERWLVRNKHLRRPKHPWTLRCGDREIELYAGQKITFTRNQANVRNGELCIIKSVTPRSSFVTECGKVIVLGRDKGTVNPRDIDLGYAITTNKSQGSEWKYVVFHTTMKIGGQWTRPFPYVAISRAKSRCFVASNLQIINKMCSNEAPARSTILSKILQ
jgi:hypothetical protein